MFRPPSFHEVDHSRIRSTPAVTWHSPSQASLYGYGQQLGSMLAALNWPPELLQVLPTAALRPGDQGPSPAEAAIAAATGAAISQATQQQQRSDDGSRSGGASGAAAGGQGAAAAPTTGGSAAQAPPT